MSQKLLIIGGSPCSGKSTAAERIAQEYGAYYFKVDDHLDELIKQETACPQSHAVPAKHYKTVLRHPPICALAFLISPLGLPMVVVGMLSVLNTVRNALAIS